MVWVSSRCIYKSAMEIGKHKSGDGDRNGKSSKSRDQVQQHKEERERLEEPLSQGEELLSQVIHRMDNIICHIEDWFRVMESILAQHQNLKARLVSPNASRPPIPSLYELPPYDEDRNANFSKLSGQVEQHFEWVFQVMHRMDNFKRCTEDRFRVLESKLLQHNNMISYLVFPDESRPPMPSLYERPPYDGGRNGEYSVSPSQAEQNKERVSKIIHRIDDLECYSEDKFRDLESKLETNNMIAGLAPMSSFY